MFRGPHGPSRGGAPAGGCPVVRRRQAGAASSHPRTVALLLLFALAACAPRAGTSPGAPMPVAPGMAATTDTAGAAAVAERWWRAFTLGDTATLRRHTSDRLTLTLSNGQALGRDALLREAATHVPKASTFVRPAEDVEVRPLAG